MQDGLFGTPPSQDEVPAGKKIVDRLQDGQLPQMVDWFDPGLLAKVGVRSVISATLGSYTDQRLMQAATDNVSEARLKNRYNYSGDGVNTAGEKPVQSEALGAESDGAVWIDYIADLGDGFEPSYAMAYLLAAETLKVRGEANPLPAGRLLIMGGDQVYPDATNQEYQDRLRDPYDWAFTTDDPQRKVFAIPGNHDWYDGLSAFSALFCSSRDRISKGIGSRLGGWRCHQHRSYFAIKLPHNWWIWGPDIQLADNLDDSQRDYFDLMAEQTSEADNIILCLAEPSWLHKNYDNMHEISMLARKNGAKICAVVAGDWHHYSRYTSDKLGIQFITAGGGGAFAHATHGLKRKIKLQWASVTEGIRSSDPGDTAAFNRVEQKVVGPGGRNFTQQAVATNRPAKASGEVDPKPSTDVEPPTSRRSKSVRPEDIKSTAYDCQVSEIYPKQWLSRLLCLKNLTLPFRNKRFAFLVGIVYFLYAWVWAASDPRQSPIMLKLSADIAAQALPAENAVSAADAELKRLTELQKLLSPDMLKTPPGEAMTRRIEQAKINSEQAKSVLDAIQARSKEIDGGRQAQLQEAIGRYQSRGHRGGDGWNFGEKFKWLSEIYSSYNSLAYVLDPKAFFAAAEQSPMFAFLLIGLWTGLMFYVELPSTFLGTIGKIAVGTLHFSAHVMALLFISWLATGTSAPVSAMLQQDFDNAALPDVARVIWNFSITLLLGGLIGGIVMGLYWTLTSSLFNMHTGDAFGALGIKDYKNFLRIKLEPGRATIYAIALDKVPGRWGWRWQLRQGEVRPSHNPQILPVDPLEPRLIEPAIAIDVSKVRP